MKTMAVLSLPEKLRALKAKLLARLMKGWRKLPLFLTQTGAMIMPTIKSLVPKEVKLPEIFISHKAMAKILYYVAESSKEIAWLGLVERTDWTDDSITLLVTEVYAPKQEVSAAAADISDEGVIQYAEKLLEEKKDVNTIRYWGHSHVNMGVTESSTDMDTFKEHIENLPEGDMYIMSIHNKQGVIRCHVYLGNGTYAENVDLKVEPLEEAIEEAAQEIKDNVTATPAAVYGSYYNRNNVGNIQHQLSHKGANNGLTKTNGNNPDKKSNIDDSEHSRSRRDRESARLTARKDGNERHNAMGCRLY